MVGSVQVEQGRRRRRRRQDSEQEILEAAQRLLRERPFRELTVDDLMAATSQSRTAFYRHFTHRQDLLVHLIGDLNEELWDMSADWLRGSGDPLVEGRQALERLADVYAVRGSLLRAIAEAASHDADVEGVYRGLVQGFVDATFGRVGASDADRAAALETLFTIWMRTLYAPDPAPEGGASGRRGPGNPEGVPRSLEVHQDPPVGKG